MAATQKKKTNTGRARSSSAPKKSSAAKRRAAPPKPVYHPTARIVGGIGCLILALCVCVTYFGVDALLLRLFENLLKGLTGDGYWLFGPALIWAGIVLLHRREKPVSLSVTAIILLPVLMGVILHLCVCRKIYELGLPMLFDLWADGRNLLCGGVISGTLAVAFSALLSRVVTIILFFVLLVTAIFCAIYMTPSRLAEILRDSFYYEEEEEEEEPEDIIRPVRKKAEEPAPAPKKRRSAVIDIPLDDDEPAQVGNGAGQNSRADQ